MTANLRVFPMRFGMADSSYTVEYMLASEVRAEIERLTAELESSERQFRWAEDARIRLRAALDLARDYLSDHGGALAHIDEALAESTSKGVNPQSFTPREDRPKDRPADETTAEHSYTPSYKHEHNYTPWWNDGKGTEYRYCSCGSYQSREMPRPTVNGTAPR